MTADTQLDFDAMIDTTRAVCALVASDVRNQASTDEVARAVAEAGREHGVISANDYRPLIAKWVNPKVIGATTNQLIAAGVLTPLPDPVRSDDRRGRNSGRWIAQYRYHESAL